MQWGLKRSWKDWKATTFLPYFSPTFPPPTSDSFPGVLQSSNWHVADWLLDFNSKFFSWRNMIMLFGLNIHLLSKQSWFAQLCNRNRAVRAQRGHFGEEAHYRVNILFRGIHPNFISSRYGWTIWFQLDNSFWGCKK